MYNNEDKTVQVYYSKEEGGGGGCSDEYSV